MPNIISKTMEDHGRSETWTITFDGSITQTDIKALTAICRQISWLWDTKITIKSDNTITYFGYTD